MRYKLVELIPKEGKIDTKTAEEEVTLRFKNTCVTLWMTLTDMQRQIFEFFGNFRLDKDGLLTKQVFHSEILQLPKK